MIMNKEKENNKGKITGIPSGIALIIILIVIGSMISSSETRYADNKNTVSGYVVSYEDFSNTLNKCGLNSYTLERDELLDDLDGEGTIGFRIKMNGANAVCYVKDGKINSIRYADIDLYRNGVVQHTLSEYIR